MKIIRDIASLAAALVLSSAAPAFAQHPPFFQIVAVEHAERVDGANGHSKVDGKKTKLAIVTLRIATPRRHTLWASDLGADWPERDSRSGTDAVALSLPVPNAETTPVWLVGSGIRVELPAGISYLRVALPVPANAAEFRLTHARPAAPATKLPAR